MKQVILLAENNDEDRDVWGRNLELAGYKVKLADSPDEARKKLREGGIDIAVIDVRLENDNDPNDISGLIIATEKAFRHIPKIMLTAHRPSAEHIQRLTDLSAVELPPAVTWVGKEQGPEKLLEIIPQVISIWPQLQHMQILTSKISKQLEDDQSITREHASKNYKRADTISFFGYGLIGVGILLAYRQHIDIGIVVAVGGIVAQILGHLVFQQLNQSNERMDRYHHELLQTYWLQLLLATCEPLPAKSQIATSEHIIKTAANSWFLTRLEE